MISFDKIRFPLRKIAFSVFFMAIGYFLHFSILKNACPEPPEIPELPKSYEGYQIYDLNRDDGHWGRNMHIQKFYEAWKNDQAYGIYELNRGLDCLMPTFWITDKGQVTRIVIDCTGLFKKRYIIDKIQDVSICYWDNDNLVRTEVDKSKYCDLILKAETIVKNKEIHN